MSDLGMSFDNGYVRKEITMNSKEKLAQALEETYRNTDQCPPLGHMIQKARDGYYSDYDSPLALPCIQLVKDLDALGLTELKTRAMNGEFDATKEESDAWYEREGKQMIQESGLPLDLFVRPEEEEAESKEGIKGWDI